MLCGRPEARRTTSASTSRIRTAVANIINQVRERSGRIDVLLHAAGIERSHFLPDKEPREFDLVFDVKSDGWFNLLQCDRQHAAGSDGSV